MFGRATRAATPFAQSIGDPPPNAMMPWQRFSLYNTVFLNVRNRCIGQFDHKQHSQFAVHLVVLATVALSQALQFLGP